jgi:hypothetical protein
MTRTDPLLLEAARKLLRAVADPQMRGKGLGRDRRADWQALEDHGLTRAWLPEAAGGAGAGIADGFAILTLAGEVAIDAPLAETLLAGWLVAAGGLAVPDGALAPATGDGVALDDDDRLRGRIAAVPFGREVDRLAVVGARRSGDSFVALVERAACVVEPRDNLAGEPRDSVVVDGVVPRALAAVGGEPRFEPCVERGLLLLEQRPDGSAGIG